MAVLNERIKERRLAQGLTLFEVAEYLGVKEATAQRYESGDIKNIKHETIVNLAELFHCSPAYLMGWDEKPITQNIVTKPEQNHLHKYRSIDEKGKHTVDTVLEMEYNRCNKPHLFVDTAHAIDWETDEERQHDDIMDDENF